MLKKKIPWNVEKISLNVKNHAPRKINSLEYCTYLTHIFSLESIVLSIPKKKMRIYVEIWALE